MVNRTMGRVVAGAVVLGACGVMAAAALAPQPDGRRIFEGKGNCWTCHGRTGQGTAIGPNLRDAEWLNGNGSVESVAAIVRAGVPRPRRFPAPMPPGGGARLNDGEVRAVAQYVVSLSAGE